MAKEFNLVIMLSGEFDTKAEAQAAAQAVKASLPADTFEKVRATMKTVVDLNPE